MSSHIMYIMYGDDDDLDCILYASHKLVKHSIRQYVKMDNQCVRGRRINLFALSGELSIAGHVIMTHTLG